jgi:N-terminal acetyltransferase B complex catalytic subunit
MTTIKQFSLFDMLSFNNINLDLLTETFNTYFYAKYLIEWPEYCVSLWNCTDRIQAYCKLEIYVVLGKVEGNEEAQSWHGHVTAVTVAPDCRKQGLARLLMNYLEAVSEGHKGFFVDLFVRASNKVAI